MQNEESKKPTVDWCCEKHCICPKCLWHNSGRCPFGSCFDDLRAKENPYDKAHPCDPPRTSWSNWENDKAHWCRGGVFYPANKCDQFIPYDGCTVQDCLGASLVKFQDGFIRCGYGENPDCVKCYSSFRNQIHDRAKRRKNQSCNEK